MKACLYAHEDDGYQHVINHRKLCKNALGQPEPAIERRKLEAPGADNGGLHDLNATFGVTEEKDNNDDYNAMFDGLQ